MAARGRPAQEPTPAEREKVKELKAEGANQKLIAKALRRSVPNLRKFFAAELGLEKKSEPAEPPFRITPDMREDVALLAACSEPHDRIAEAVGITQAELAEFFADELERGAARYRLKALKRLDVLAGAGNASAVKQLAAMTAPPIDPAAAPTGYVGKKEAAKAQAVEAAAEGGKFAPRAAPRLAAVDGKKI